MDWESSEEPSPDRVLIVYGVFAGNFINKSLILLESGTGIEPVYTDLQLEDSNII